MRSVPFSTGPILSAILRGPQGSQYPLIQDQWQPAMMGFDLARQGAMDFAPNLTGAINNGFGMANTLLALNRQTDVPLKMEQERTNRLNTLLPAMLSAIGGQGGNFQGGFQSNFGQGATLGEETSAPGSVTPGASTAPSRAARPAWRMGPQRR